MSQPEVVHATHGISCRIAASMENVELFIAGVHGFLAEESLGQLSFDMELLAREALVNAVLHGCGSDPSRFVDAALRRDAGTLVLTVSDAGPGWNWRDSTLEAPDPASDKGRGLFIIRKYSDGYYYNDPGNALTITKRVPTEVQHMDACRNNETRLSLEARLTAQDVPTLREFFRKSILDGARRIVLDCANLESLDSMGIGLLVATHNSLAKLGGSLALVSVRQEILQLLTLMRLDKHIHMSPAAEA